MMISFLHYRYTYLNKEVKGRTKGFSVLPFIIFRKKQAICFFNCLCIICYDFNPLIMLFLQKKKMKQLHAHEVLHMMEGNSYSESSLRDAIIQKFGKDQRFYTCSAENMNVYELIEFLKKEVNLCLQTMGSLWI